MSGGILCKGVVLKVHRVINYNSMYIIIGYDINTPLMTMYEIMTLCKHRMRSAAKFIKGSTTSSHTWYIPIILVCCANQWIPDSFLQQTIQLNQLFAFIKSLQVSTKDCWSEQATADKQITNCKYLYSEDCFAMPLELILKALLNSDYFIPDWSTQII